MWTKCISNEIQIFTVFKWFSLDEMVFFIEKLSTSTASSMAKVEWKHIVFPINLKYQKCPKYSFWTLQLSPAAVQCYYFSDFTAKFENTILNMQRYAVPWLPADVLNMFPPSSDTTLVNPLNTKCNTLRLLWFMHYADSRVLSNWSVTVSNNEKELKMRADNFEISNIQIIKSYRGQGRPLIWGPSVKGLNHLQALSQMTRQF